MDIPLKWTSVYLRHLRVYTWRTPAYLLVSCFSVCSDDDITAGFLFFLRALDDDTYTPSMSVMISCSWRVLQYGCGWEGLYDYDLHMPLLREAF